MSTVLPVGQERPSTQGVQVPVFSLAAFDDTIPQAKSENWKCFRIIMFKDFGFEHPQFIQHTPTHATFLVVKKIQCCNYFKAVGSPDHPLLLSNPAIKQTVIVFKSHPIKEYRWHSFRRHLLLNFFGFSAPPFFCPKGNKTEPPNLNVPTQDTSAHVTSTTRRTTHDVIYLVIWAEIWSNVRTGKEH